MYQVIYLVNFKVKTMGLWWVDVDLSNFDNTKSALYVSSPLMGEEPDISPSHSLSQQYCPQWGDPHNRNAKECN